MRLFCFTDLHQTAARENSFAEIQYFTSFAQNGTRLPAALFPVHSVQVLGPWSLPTVWDGPHLIARVWAHENRQEAPSYCPESAGSFTLPLNEQFVTLPVFFPGTSNELNFKITESFKNAAVSPRTPGRK